MQRTKEYNLKLLSLIGTFCVLLSALYQDYHYFRLKYRLESPFIPHSVVRQIAATYLNAAIWMTLAAVILLILQWRKYHNTALLLSLTTLLIARFFIR